MNHMIKVDVTIIALVNLKFEILIGHLIYYFKNSWISLNKLSDMVI